MSKAIGSRFGPTTVTFAIPPRLSEPRTTGGLRPEQEHVEEARERRPVPSGGDVPVAHVAHDG